LKQAVQQWTVPTRGRGFYEITDLVTRWAHGCGVKDGVVTVHVKHTSASLLIQENADPEVRRDLERFFSRLVPDGDRLFEHTAEGPDDMPAHVRCALTASNLSIPMIGGEVQLGTWQGVYLWEHRTAPHQRKIVAHLIGV
jgi:secondary thiamine-phosphate synthase enzyme